MSEMGLFNKWDDWVRRICFVLRTISFGCLFFAMHSASAETLVGELPGEFVVNHLGAASYTISLTGSPGTAGMEPKLSISYSSRGGNGLLGLGFSLGGLSTIARGGASLDQDQFIDGVDLDESDRFLLDGKRLELVALNGTATTNKAYYGDAKSEYRTEIDSFSRVIAYGQAGRGPEYFRVWTKSGLIYEYGNTPDSAFKPGSYPEVLRWHVNKISDSVGNYITFRYETTSAGPQICEINYTGNVAENLTPYNSVEFVYEDRPDDKLSFFMGVEMKRTNRLAKIVMKHDGVVGHDYRFRYTTNEAGQSLVESIQQFFGNGIDCLPKTLFDYSGQSNGTGFSYIDLGRTMPVTNYADVYDGAQDRVLTGDFNGDGLTDLCGLGSSDSHRWVGLSQGDGSFAFTSGTNFLKNGFSFSACWEDGVSVPEQIYTGDFNGDGMTDLWCMGLFNRWVALSNGDGTFEFTSLDGISFVFDEMWYRDGVEKAHFYTGDFNGDGMTDLCCMGFEHWVGLSNGDGTFEITPPDHPLLEGLVDFVVPNTPFWNQSDAWSYFSVGDFNGDGLSDLCSMGCNKWLGLSDGDGTFSFTSGDDFCPHGFSTTSGDASQFLTDDFNGDGLLDLCALHCCSGWVGLSKGDGTFDYTTGIEGLGISTQSDAYTEADKAFAGDFNGDGKTDVCALGCANWVGLSNGDGHFTFTSGTNFLEKGFHLYLGKDPYGSLANRFCSGDFNGDGMTDFCGFGSRTWIGLSGNEATRLTKVTQGYQSASQHGVVTEIEYLPLTDTNVYVKGSGARYPICDFVSPLGVVSEMRKDNGQEGTYKTQYAYRSARTHMRGRGFLGFQQFISYDCETDICTTETLAHDFPFTGRQLKTETAYIPDSAGDPNSPGYSQPITRVENDWQFDLVDGGTLFVYNSKSVETKWELGNPNDIVSKVTSLNWFDHQDPTQRPSAEQPTQLEVISCMAIWSKTSSITAAASRKQRRISIATWSILRTGFLGGLLGRLLRTKLRDRAM